MNLLNKPFCTMCFEYLHDGHYGWDICPTCIEAFRYQGVRIFGPHIDVDKLVELARFKDNLDLREEAEAAL
jgi:nitrate reductase beta subunit